MPQFDLTTFTSTIFWLLVCFGSVLFCFNRLILPNYDKSIQARLNEIHNNIDQASQANLEADTLLKLCDEKINAAKQEANDSFENKLNIFNENAKLQIETFKTEIDFNLKSNEKKYKFEHEELVKKIDHDVEELVHQILNIFTNSDKDAITIQGKKDPSKSRMV